MSKQFSLGKIHVSNPKVWIVIGVGVAGVLILAETQRRRLRATKLEREDFGAFIERFELLPFPQPPPPAARQPLYGLTFAIKDIFDVKDYVTGFGNPDWKRTHEASGKTAVVVTALLKNGATCVGKTVMDELAFGITGENVHYGTPSNPQMPSHIPGGSSSGSAVAVASELVDFAIGCCVGYEGDVHLYPCIDPWICYLSFLFLFLVAIEAIPLPICTDTIGCVRTPASLCGILGFRPSHGVVSTFGVLPNTQSLDTVGWFARDPSILHRVGHILLQLNQVEPRRTRRFIVADDLFQLSKVPKQKTVQVVSCVTENLSGYQPPKHINFGQYIASNVSSLKGFHEESTNLKNGISTLKALSSVMFLLQRYEFKTNHEEWVKSTKPRLGPDVSDRVRAAISTAYENIKSLYKVRTEMRSALQSLLKIHVFVFLLYSRPNYYDVHVRREDVHSQAGNDIIYFGAVNGLSRVIGLFNSRSSGQDDGILVLPTIADPPLKLNSKKGLSAEFHDRASALLSIASMSGCCQVTIPLGNHDGCPISVSFIAFHGADKFLLDTVLDMYSSLQKQVSLVSNSPSLPDMNGNMDASELLKEKAIATSLSSSLVFATSPSSLVFASRTQAIATSLHTGHHDFSLLFAGHRDVSLFAGLRESHTGHHDFSLGNAAFKGRQWNKAVSYYSEAIKLNEMNATYYCNRAAAYLELGCFREAVEDCSKAISLDKKNVKAYLRRGTARESLLFYKEALQDFKHALVLEPQNKLANLAEKRLRKLTS
ncbi:hypothetical protein TEA_004409 [Camellia sinensis var. sinensis]|uniref:Amidase domain-containing protein n=1 Tax=Camellia sinensis var. sinensis TaxID=542762 RepID=A0A4S4DG09_CAMSN|nr:hypothetical protein TEA_004409 [Camellia sinensis var. sinensis]